MNKIMLIGRLTKDPELRYTQSGSAVASFTLAVNRRFANQNGEREADFINCVAFNKQAENLCRFIKKGGQIGVEGKLQTRRYTAQDGSNRIATEVICDAIHFLEPRGASQGGYNDYSSYETSYMQQPQQPQQQMPSQNNFFNQVNPKNDQFDDVKKQFDISDDDLPF